MKQVFTQLSAIALLLCNSTVIGINIKQNSQENTGRYLNSQGVAINLAQETGHARLELKKTSTVESVVEEVLNSEDTSPALALGVTIKNKDDKGTCPLSSGHIKIPQHNHKDSSYVGEISVGNPPQIVRAYFDTGSTNTWILNKELKESQKTAGDYSYNHKASKTNQISQLSAKISFGSGSLGGHFHTDDLRLGSCEGPGQIVIKNQQFGNVEEQKTIFNGQFEAIVGLAYPQLAQPGIKPVFDQVMEQKLLQQNIFAFYLAYAKDEEKGSKSELTFGYYDKEKYTGDLHWIPVEFKYMFGVKLEDIKVNGKSTQVCKDKECLITFDSGTALLSMPTYAIQSLAQQGIPNQKDLKPCKNRQQFGELVYVMGGKNYPLTNYDWMLDTSMRAQISSGEEMGYGLGPEEVSLPRDNLNIQAPKESIPAQHLVQTEINETPVKNAGMTEKCQSYIMTMNLKKNMFIVGDIFMRKYYTVFDRDHDRVGLALAVQPK